MQRDVLVDKRVGVHGSPRVARLYGEEDDLWAQGSVAARKTTHKADDGTRPMEVGYLGNPG